MLNRYVETGQHYFVPDLSGIVLNFSPFNLILAIGLLYIAFVMFGYVSCIPDLSKTFIMRECWILLKAFSAFNEMIMCFFFQFIFIVDYINRFSYIEPSLYLWEDKLIMEDDLFDVFLDSVCQYCIEYFCVSVYEEDWFVILIFS